MSHLNPEDQDLLRNWQAGPGARPTDEDVARWAAARHRLPVRQARSHADAPVGNDGLTDDERAESAQRWRDGAGRAPDKDEMNDLRARTPITRRPRQEQAPIEDFDVETAAAAHYDRLTGHDLPLAERRDRIRALSHASTTGSQDRDPALNWLTDEEVYDLFGIRPIDSGEVGNDGLTDAERAEYARRYNEGAGKKPTAEQMAQYRELGAQMRREHSTGDPDTEGGTPKPPAEPA